MKTNKKISIALSIAMLTTMIPVNFVSADNMVTKEETVYVNLDNGGNPEEIISSIWIHSGSPLGKVEDKSTLKEVVNVKGEEKPTIKDDKILWETDKNDIFYQGKTDKELPIKVDIKYFLEGEEVLPEEIVGKSGKIKIVINVVNKDKKTITLKNGENKGAYTPYMVATLVNLPIDKFTNIETNTGKIVSDGSNKAITFVTLPGFDESLGLNKKLVDLPNTLEINADVVDFQMKPIMITALSQIPEINELDDVGDVGELIEGIDKMKEASEKLTEATDKLFNGQVELEKGISELTTGIDGINTGANSLKEGSLKLKEGINTTYEGSKKIDEGVNVLSKSAGQLGEGFINISQGAVEFGNKSLEFSKGAMEMAKGVEKIPETTETLGGGIDELIKGTETLKSGQDSLTQGLDKSLQALGQIKKGKEKESKVIDMLLKGVNGLETIAEAIGKVPGVDSLSNKLMGGLESQKIALEGLKNSSNELVLALNQVEAGLKEAEEASKELSKGIDNMNNGQVKISSGLKQLNEGTKGLKDVSDQLMAGSEGLKDGADKLNESAIKAKEGADGFSNGTKELTQGTNELTNGLGELKKGSESLYSGIDELSKGTGELSKGGNKLNEGSHKLIEGSKELNEGMNTFHQEAVVKMSEELSGSNVDVNNLLETKDSLIELSKENKSFSGISEDMEGSVKFIMKTEEIKGEEKQEKLEVKVEQKEEKGFIAWLKGIFKK
ncbi:hypothetical protein KQI42_19270 [Tissierella sp. MSJ-40]|uniref:X-X-X-Leu-X-X-Gly heptad repeat-containing protein n=1 Tax=Tissierella simiarum TaxID=2841534 RepID=A0ABS6EB39_9FIRM|nr:hypothetical protein [Tissierella simiarum]MBU5440137.1 hypothetical protein [Tissierella simiarum]